MGQSIDFQSTCNTSYKLANVWKIKEHDWMLSNTAASLKFYQGNSLLGILILLFIHMMLKVVTWVKNIYIGLGGIQKSYWENHVEAL